MHLLPAGREKPSALTIYVSFEANFVHPMRFLGFGSVISLSTLRLFRCLHRRKTRYVVGSVPLLRQDFHLQDRPSFAWRTSRKRLRARLRYRKLLEIKKQLLIK